MIKVGNNLIVNTDSEIDIKNCPDGDCIVLTCGLKLNSTVTASSIDEYGFTFCLQRSVYTLSNNIISPQEFNVHYTQKPDDLFPLLSVVTAMLLCDIDPKVFELIRF